LATGSINEAKRLGLGVPDNVLDQIKRKIVLFDGEQTKFIFDEPNKKRITIQGLAGTGKTELLLHKIKELYTTEEDCKIVFTCHNEILADSLRKRVPEFFDFMKVEEQIQWEKRLWVMRSWGSRGNPQTGVYSYICSYYQIPFSSYSYMRSFDKICKDALSRLEQIEDFHGCFDYILIDESQDFSDGFFALCEKVAEKCVYVAGDIFQDIFENKSLTVVNPDFMLNKCYRTDPRTLMGAHAIGMGLFEQKLRWLKDDEWEACGYNVERDEKHIILHRKPLMRFEDIDMSKTDGITIIPSENCNYLSTVLHTIDKIIGANPTVLPDDIGIIFMENIDANFKLAANLQVMIHEKYNWTVNIGYETKEKKEGTLFVSNRNNVKGLEFPFVICIMQGVLSNDFSVRNSIYMMLTRSFLTSYLILPSQAKNIKMLTPGIEFVNRKGYLIVEEPSEKEKESLANAIIKRTNLHKSLYDLAEEIMDQIGVTKKENRQALHEMTKARFNKEVDRDKLEEFIQTNWSMMEQ
jgi:superfamily I DNA and RNA helicase